MCMYTWFGPCIPLSEKKSEDKSGFSASVDFETTRRTVDKDLREVQYYLDAEFGMLKSQVAAEKLAEIKEGYRDRLRWE